MQDHHSGPSADRPVGYHEGLLCDQPYTTPATPSSTIAPGVLFRSWSMLIRLRLKFGCRAPLNRDVHADVTPSCSKVARSFEVLEEQKVKAAREGQRTLCVACVALPLMVPLNLTSNPKYGPVASVDLICNWMLLSIATCILPLMIMIRRAWSWQDAFNGGNHNPNHSHNPIIVQQLGTDSR